MSGLVDAVRVELKRAADPVKAPEMQRYMKSEMLFRGVAKPERTVLAKKLFAEHVMSDVDELRQTTLELWRGAEYREERYLAIDLTGDRRYARWQTKDLLPMYDEMIVTGAWWDFVDELAIRRVGPILLRQWDEVAPIMRAWATDEDLWRRRTSIICQVGAKTEVDTELLAEAIEANIHDRDFFLRKGIGWALRQHSKVDAAWVRTFVSTHPDLSPLSRKEATKYL
ncbi:DNA alkylation repair protein [Kibdelosporangium aridum]|uniref:DNA alkylation repair protein n=1 Tax=Kibdelosporangium aridum TaxID=2030 RepID=A0A428ZD49_KIBAR|nr:DNA alkylation repair protein [Kibdelosporangium aridum]RSM86002.1 DNA alkylation repair protein [Kibdelosporangium aridum]